MRLARSYSRGSITTWARCANFFAKKSVSTAAVWSRSSRVALRLWKLRRSDSLTAWRLSCRRSLSGRSSLAMTTNTSSTAAASSDVAKRVEEAVESTATRLSAERLEHLKQVKERADALSSRGLLQHQGYSSPAPAQIGEVLRDVEALGVLREAGAELSAPRTRP